MRLAEPSMATASVAKKRSERAVIKRCQLPPLQRQEWRLPQTILLWRRQAKELRVVRPTIGSAWRTSNTAELFASGHGLVSDMEHYAAAGTVTHKRVTNSYRRVWQRRRNWRNRWDITGIDPSLRGLVREHRPRIRAAAPPTLAASNRARPPTRADVRPPNLSDVKPARVPGWTTQRCGDVLPPFGPATRACRSPLIDRQEQGHASKKELTMRQLRRLLRPHPDGVTSWRRVDTVGSEGLRAPTVAARNRLSRLARTEARRREEQPASSSWTQSVSLSLRLDHLRLHVATSSHAMQPRWADRCVGRQEILPYLVSARWHGRIRARGDRQWSPSSWALDLQGAI